MSRKCGSFWEELGEGVNTIKMYENSQIIIRKFFLVSLRRMFSYKKFQIML